MFLNKQYVNRQRVSDVRLECLCLVQVCKEVVERNWNWAKLGYEETRRQEWAKVTTSAVETRYSATEDKRLQIFASFTYKPGLVIPTVQLSGEQLGQAVSLGELTQDDFKMVQLFFSFMPSKLFYSSLMVIIGDDVVLGSRVRRVCHAPNVSERSRDELHQGQRREQGGWPLTAADAGHNQHQEHHH